MKITVTISESSKITTIDFYPNESVLYFKVNGTSIRREITEEQATSLEKVLTENPIGNFIEYLQRGC
jgi:hypothetical protein